MEEIFIFMIGLSIIIGFIFIYSSNQDNKKTGKQSNNSVIKSETSKELNEKLKKISLTNFLLIFINILLIIIIYQMLEIKDDIPESCGAVYYLKDIEEKIDKVNGNLDDINYKLYKIYNRF